MENRNEQFGHMINDSEDENKRAKVALVLTHDGEEDQKIKEWLEDFYKDTQYEFISSYQLPDQPPAGVENVYTNSDPKFRTEKQKENWKGVTFTSLVHARDASFITFGQSKKSQDFIAEHKE